MFYAIIFVAVFINPLIFNTMRYVRYMAPVESVSGKWAQKDVKAGEQTLASNTPRTLFISQRRDNIFGFKAYFAIKNNNRTSSYTAQELAQQTRFKAVAARVVAAYSNPSMLQSYKQQWEAAGKEVTLRKYIWDAEQALYDASAGV